MQIDSRGAWSVAHFCDDHDIGHSLLYEEVKRGRLRITKIGRKSIVTAEDRRDWLAALPKLVEAEAE